MRLSEIKHLRILRSFAAAQDDKSMVRLHLGNSPFSRETLEGREFQFEARVSGRQITMLSSRAGKRRWGDAVRGNGIGVDVIVENNNVLVRDRSGSGRSAGD